MYVKYCNILFGVLSKKLYNENMKNRIEINPNILAGKPVIAGTRIPVTLILNLLAHGQTMQDIIEDYPDLTAEDIKAAIQYAQEVVEKGTTYHKPHA